jgi:3-oxoacyl-[acyl-carrier protein] reductase
MEFHDQIVLICGVADELGPRIAESTLRRGAHTVVLVGEMASASQVHHHGKGELICIPDNALSGLRDTVDSIRQFGRIDTLINLVTVAENPLNDPASGASDASEIPTACEAVVRKTCRVIDATRDLLQRSRPYGTIVNVGWLATETAGAMPAAASAAFGSLKVLTQALAKELAPHIRVNAVLSEGIAAPSQTHSIPTTVWQISHKEESIGPALFLASPAARHMTGTILTANAGRRLGFAALSKPHEGKIERPA